MIKFILKCFVPFLLTLISIYVYWKANSFTNTANLLEIINAIHDRTNAILAVERKDKELDMWNDSNIVKDETFFEKVDSRKKLIVEERDAAIYSLLNVYEFACIQYIKNKINKEAFKSIFSGSLKSIKDEYKIYFIGDGLQENYEAINRVYKEWN